MPADTRPHVVIPGDDPMRIGDSPHLARLQAHAEVTLHRTRPMTDEEKLERVAEADVMINSRGAVKWPGELLRQLPRLKMIAICGIGTDSIDLAAARELGIVVSNIPGLSAGIVAEHALALLLSCARDIPRHTAKLREGQWVRRELVFLRGKTLGIVGTGAIGREMIRLSRALGMNVLAWSFHPQPELAAELGFQYVPLQTLLQQSDAVSLHVRASPESRHLLGRKELQQMRPGSILINTARAAVVDTEALLEALRNGPLMSAGLDVFDIEPIPPGHPLLSCENAFFTPHCADQTPEGADILNGGAVDNVLAFLAGRPQHDVTRDL